MAIDSMGVKENDADKAAHSVHEASALIVGALQVASNLGGRTPASPHEAASDPRIAIQVGDENVDSPLSELPDKLEQQSDAFLEQLRAAIQDPERPEGATVVEIYANHSLKFYRDEENQFNALDFPLKPYPQEHTNTLANEVADFLTDGMTSPENPEPLIDLQVGSGEEATRISATRDNLAEEINSTLNPDQIESLHDTLIGRKPSEGVVAIRDENNRLCFYAEGKQRFDQLSEAVASTRAVETDIPSAEVEPAPVSPAEPAVASEQSAPPPEIEYSPAPASQVEAEPVPSDEVDTVPEVVQIPVSEAEAIGGQTLAESSTVNPEVWSNQTQVFTAQLDQHGNVQTPTATIGQSVDAIADQVELTEQSQEIAFDYAEQLDEGREQTTGVAEAHDQFFDKQRETSDAVAEAHDQFFDERREMAEADAVAEMPEGHRNIAAMLEQACNLCYGENSGTQTIYGHHYVIERDADFLSVTAKDGRGTILEKKGGEITSSLTPQDEQNFQMGFAVLQQQQERQGGSTTTVPSVSTTAVTAARNSQDIELE